MRCRLVIALVTLAVLATGAVVSTTPAVPDFARVRAEYRASEAVLVDRRGVPLHELRVDPAVRRLDWIALDAVSPALRDAIVAAEDKRFYAHAGIDWRALAAATWGNLRRERPRGASTLTMQLAGLLDPSLRPAAGGRSLTQKWRQLREARVIESRWTKAQILEAYLNLVGFRGELQGVAAASWGVFGKAPSGLQRGEALLLATLVRAPNASPAFIARRACALAQAPVDSLDCARLERLAALHVGSKPHIRGRFDAAPHIARTLLDRPGTRIATTLDARVQRFAREALKRHLLALSSRNVEDGAVLVLDNASGDILAYVASSGELSDAAQVDGITARRQAGSTLKPFLYELAIERRWLTAASILDDSPLDVVTPAGLYVPQNYDRDFKGAVSLRTALASSLNVPAVRTLVLMGFDPFHERLHALGFDSLTESADHYGYALALGGADVSLLELTNAYRTLANGGMRSRVRVTLGEAEPPQRVMDADAAFVIADILSDRSARALTFGFDSPLVTRSWSAVKTGTSKDMRDNWTVGFSDRYTVGVWVGNFSGAPMWDVSGVSGAAPVWQEVMHELHRDAPSRPPAAPTGVVTRRVTFEPAIEAAREERFLAGTEQTQMRLASRQAAPPRILYPGDGSIIALDPDIPAERQRVVLRASDARGMAWRMDGAASGSARQTAFWTPQPGRHRLALIDDTGREVDAVSFEVRGAVAPQSMRKR